MSVFDNTQSFVGFVHEGQRLSSDSKLLAAYTKQIEGVGLETLEKDPAYQLITQAMTERYGKYVVPGTGNEGLGLALIGIGAAAAFGYASFKKMMIAKNSPMLKDLKTAEQKVNSTYTAAWLNDKESVEKDVGCGIITKLFAGKNFAAVSKELEKYVNDLTGEFKKATDLQIKTWKEIEPKIRLWGESKDPVERKKIVDDLVAKYGWDVWKKICADVPIKKEDGKADKLPSLTKDEYGKAVALLKSLLTKLNEVDEQTEDVWHNVGLWEYLYQFGDDADDIWAFGYSEHVNDYHGHLGYRVHQQLIDMGRGLEEWITKSFK